jgi:C-8 sterol isomerase
MPLFDPDAIDAVAHRHIGTRPFQRMFENIGADLKARYPDDVYLDQPLVFNSAGGIMYQLKIFAMTPTEYIMICGSSISSSGYSGRHPVAFWDTVLSGEARYMHEGELEAHSYRAGDRIFVDRWQVATIDFPDHCWMLEYARGTLPALLPFGMANTFFNALDFTSARRLLTIYATLALRYYRRRPAAVRLITISTTAAARSGLWWLRSRGRS